MKKLANNTPLLFGGVALLLTMIALVACESDYLFRVEELNLFLYTPLFFKQQLVVAGGLLTWAGTYFTQFFYHPWIGSLLLCLWLGLLMWLVQKTFRLPHLWVALMLLPAAMVLLTDFDLGYWIYYLKLRGHFFITVMGTSMAIGLVWLYRSVTKRIWQSYAIILLTAIVGYPIAGFYGLLSVALMGIIAWRLPFTLSHKIQASALAAVCIGFTPPVYYRALYYQANFNDIWWQALPRFEYDKTYNDSYYPYVILVGVLLFLAACYQARFMQKAPKRSWQTIALQAGTSLLVVLFCGSCWFKDKAFYEEVTIINRIDQADWNGVMTVIKEHQGEPTRLMVMSKNLALFKLGRAGNEAYSYPDGSLAPKCPFELRIAQTGGKHIYLFYGLPNFCYRWCLEDGVELGWRTEHLKLMARCAILNGETSAAKKYLGLLRQTRYHSDWADRYERLLNDRQQLAADREMGPILRIMDGKNTLASDQSVIELFLLNSLAYRETKDPVCAELTLLMAMQLKDIPAFWVAFVQYATLHQGQPMPRHFQEAAFLYGHLENKVDISHMPFDPSVVKSYQNFMKMAEQYQNASEERIKAALYPSFGNTFYYNYFLMRNLKAY